MVGTQFKVLVLLTITLYVSACAHHTVVVKCDGKLEPINVPEPKSAEIKPDPSKAPHPP
jgi:hypothetical protein